MPDVNAAPDARIHILDRLQHVERRMPYSIFRPVIVNRDADIELLDELLDSRQRLRCGVAGDNHRNPCSLAVFKLRPDIRVFIFREIDGSSSVKPDTRRGIVGQRSRLRLRLYREMSFDILHIQREHIELLHEADHLRTIEVTECVASQAQTNRRCFDSCRAFLSQYEGVAGSSERCRGEGSGANEIATGEPIFHKGLVARSLPRMLS